MAIGSKDFRVALKSRLPEETSIWKTVQRLENDGVIEGRKAFPLEEMLASMSSKAKAVTIDITDALSFAMEKREEGWTLQAVADHLNKEKVFTKRGKEWRPQSLRHMLIKGKE